MERNSGNQSKRVERQNAIYDSLAGLVFMGTPQLGSGIVNKDRVKLLETLARITFKKPPKKIVNALAAHSGELEKLSDAFRMTTVFTKHDIEIVSAYETIATAFVGERVSMTLAAPLLSNTLLTFHQGGATRYD